MSNKIIAKDWLGGKSVCVTVDHKDFDFCYIKPSIRDLKRKGRSLSLTLKAGGHSSAFLRLNGTQINTLKKILKVAGEIK